MGGAGGAERCGVGEALLSTLAAFALVPLLGGALQRLFGVGGVALTEVLCVGAPALFAIGWSRARPGAALGGSVPTARGLLGALVAAAGAFVLVAAGVEGLQERLWPMPPALRAQLRAFIVPPSGPRPLVVDLAVLALLPALCEEALFRGVLLRALAPWGRGRALAASALAFGAFHYSLYKLAPTAALGAILGAMALASGGLWAPLVGHLVNNAVVVCLVRAGIEDLPGTGPGAGLLGGLRWAAGAAIAVGVGLRLLDRGAGDRAG